MRTLGLLAVLVMSFVTSTAAAAAPASLPVETRTLTSDSAQLRHCFQHVAANARGVDKTVWRAPMSGFATIRLAASAGSDWDLAVFDAASGRKLTSSAGFGSREIAQTWVQSGQRLLIQGCRREGTDGSVRVALQLLDVKPPASAGTPALLRVAIDGREDIERLDALGVDVTHHIHDGAADVIVSGAGQARLLRERGFSFETEIANLTERYAASRRADAAYTAQAENGSPLPSGRTTYRVYDDFQTELKALAEAHPDIVKPMTLPKRSFQGRELQGVEIAENVNAAPDDGRPVYLVVALHHAREWPSAEMAMEFAILLADQYGKDARITDLLRRSRVVIVPLINPDGYVSSRNAVDPADELRDLGFNPNLDKPVEGQDLPTDCFLTGSDPCDAPLSLIESISPPGGLFSYRRKNCNGALPEPQAPCELQYGVDPNRNYGHNWGGEGSEGDPLSQSYRGPGPWSETETQAVHEYSQRRQITNIVTIHNVAALVLRPPGLQSEGLAPDEARLKEIGDAMAAETGYTSQYGWQLYDTSGTTEDWNYAAQGAYGYTIEIGPKNGEFHMPYEVGFVNEWTGDAAGGGDAGGLQEALMVGWEAAANPADHGVIAGTAPAGRTLRLRKDFLTKTFATCRLEAQVPLLNNDFGVLAQVPRCLEEADAMEIPDFTDTTITVPASGAFEWHVNPSTRPFVGADKTIPGELEENPAKTQSFDGPGPGNGTPGDTTELPFSIADGDPRAHLALTLEWPVVPEDYDLELFRIVNGEREPFGNGDTDVGSSGNLPGSFEHITADDVPAGDYVAVVHNFAAGANDWTLTVDQFRRQPDQVVPGQREAWTLTCEDGAGSVLHQREVFVDRGERVTLDLGAACGA